MAEFIIKDEDFALLSGQVIVITGCSSGIGLATSKLLLQTGAIVVGGDLNNPPADLLPEKHGHGPNKFRFQRTSVTAWSELSALFKLAYVEYGRIDHVFANAGVTGQVNYINGLVDKDGELTEPSHSVYDINFKGVVNTVALAVHYMQRSGNHDMSAGTNSTSGHKLKQRDIRRRCSIVVTASASSFQRFRVVDYAAAKHGVLGLMRGMVPALESESIPIRINVIAPSCTLTGIVSKMMMEVVGRGYQSPEAPARSVALLMADSARQGQLIYSWEGRYKEIDEILLNTASENLEQQSDDVVIATYIEKTSQRANLV